jgi:superfamily II DNA or RNA helicase
VGSDKVHPGWEKARPYQRDAAVALAAGKKRGLWHSTGVGKTISTLLAMALVDRWPVLVVTKAIGRHVWERDAKWALDNISVSTMWAGSKRSKDGRHRDGTYSGLAAALEDGQIVVVNYEVLKTRYKELRNVAWAGLVLDEAHSVKQGYQPPLKYEDTGKAKWRTFEAALYLSRDVRRNGGYVWELTATPIRDRLRDLWGQLIIVDQSTLWRWDWLQKYCGAHPGQYGWVTEETNKANLPELKARLAQLFSVIKRSTVADQMPRIQRDVRTVNGKISWRYLGGGIETAIDQAAEQKAEHVVELALEYLGNGEKVVAVTNRKRLAGKLTGMIQEAARKNVPPKYRRDMMVQMVTGDTAVKPRRALLDAYQDHKGAACIIATADCMMESIDLHQSDGLIFCAIPYTPYALVQMEGRVARIGGKPCTIHYLVAENSIDVELKERLLSKLDTVERADADTQGAAGAVDAFNNRVNGDEVIAGLRDWLSSLESGQ